MSITSGMSFSWISNTLGEATSKREASLQNTLTSMGDNPSTATLLTVQHQIQDWTIFVQTSTTMVKAIGDACKDIIHKSA
jgi:type III secretion apparatus needle protein